MAKKIDNVKKMFDYVEGALQQKKTVGFVPTMGAFHDGHLSLIRKAREENDIVIVSLFVNPLQFSVGEDFDTYPRQESRDTQMVEAEGIDVLFTPSVAEIYPKGFLTYVDMDALPDKLCGATRTGHFRGVLTIVTKLLQIIRASRIYVGQKDFQQAVLIRRLITDLNLRTDISILPIIREEDGLAMSSRNVYLGPKHRKDATVLYEALRHAQELISHSEHSATVVIHAMKKMIRKVKSAKIEYVSIVNQDTLEPVKEIKGKMLCAVAVRIGKVRLIDNCLIQ